MLAEFLLLSLLFIPPPESEDSDKNYILRSILFLPWLRLFESQVEDVLLVLTLSFLFLKCFGTCTLVLVCSSLIF